MEKAKGRSEEIRQRGSGRISARTDLQRVPKGGDFQGSQQGKVNQGKGRRKSWGLALRNSDPTQNSSSLRPVEDLHCSGGPWKVFGGGSKHSW